MSTESTPPTFSLLDWLQEHAPVFSEGSLVPILQKFGLPENQTFVELGLGYPH